MAQVIHTKNLREGDRVRFVYSPGYIGQEATVIRLGVKFSNGERTGAVVVRLDGSGVEKWVNGEAFELLAHASTPAESEQE